MYCLKPDKNSFGAYRVSQSVFAYRLTFVLSGELAKYVEYNRISERNEAEGSLRRYYQFFNNPRL